MLVTPKRYGSSSGPAIVTWADGTDEEIAAMVASADAGEIDLSDYWSIGDERTVHLSAMTAGDAFPYGQPEQDVVWVLMNEGYGNQNVHFVVGQKGCLTNNGILQVRRSDQVNYKDSIMRTALNNDYYNAVPSTLRGCLKQFNVSVAEQYNGSTLTTFSEYVSLFAEKEVVGAKVSSADVEVAALSQINYYETLSNRIKASNFWFLRSKPTYSAYNFCVINTSGAAVDMRGDSTYGMVAPFMCI